MNLPTNLQSTFGRYFLTYISGAALLIAVLEDGQPMAQVPAKHPIPSSPVAGMSKRAGSGIAAVTRGPCRRLLVKMIEEIQSSQPEVNGSGCRVMAI